MVMIFLFPLMSLEKVLFMNHLERPGRVGNQVKPLYRRELHVYRSAK